MLTGTDPVYYLEHRGKGRLNRRWVFRRFAPEFFTKFLVFSEFRWMYLAGQIPDDEGVTESYRHKDRTGHSASLLADRVVELIRNKPRDRRLFVVAYDSGPHAPFLDEAGKPGGYDSYQQEILLLDRAVARVFDALAEHRLTNETMVILTADHGEEFGEHGFSGEHGTSLLEEQINVALVVWHPSLPPRAIDVPVSLAGLVATLQDAAHVRGGGQPIYPSWLPLMAGEIEAAPPLVQHWTGFFVRTPVRKTALIQGNLKLVYDWRTTASFLYRLDGARELAAQDPRKTAELTKKLIQLQEHSMLRSRVGGQSN